MKTLKSPETQKNHLLIQFAVIWALLDPDGLSGISLGLKCKSAKPDVGRLWIRKREHGHGPRFV